MAGLSKCVDEFSEESLVAIHNSLFERLSILRSTVRLQGRSQEFRNGGARIRGGTTCMTSST